MNAIPGKHNLFNILRLIFLLSLKGTSMNLCKIKESIKMPNPINIFLSKFPFVKSVILEKAKIGKWTKYKE